MKLYKINYKKKGENLVAYSADVNESKVREHFIDRLQGAEIQEVVKIADEFGEITGDTVFVPPKPKTNTNTSTVSHV